MRRTCALQIYFNPRSPRGERHLWQADGTDETLISIHALREESDRVAWHFAPWRLSISIHALREESDANWMQYRDFLLISIHALREESDLAKRERFFWSPISIHALREESDQILKSFIRVSVIFQSTLSARRATLCSICICFGIKYFNPRSPRGERRKRQYFKNRFIKISIHALREESDAFRWVL